MCEKAITPLAYQQGSVWQPCMRKTITPLAYQQVSIWQPCVRKAITPLAYQQVSIWQPCVRKTITPLAYQQVSIWQPCVRRPLHHWLTSRYQSDSHVWEGHYTTGLPAGISLTAMCEKAITPLAYQQGSIWQPCVRRPLHHWLTSRYQSDSHVWEGHYTTGLPAGISLTAMHGKAITPLAYQQVSVWQPCVRRPLHHWLTSRYQSDSHAWEGHYTTGLPAGISLTAMCEKAITPLAYQQVSVWQPCMGRPLHHWLTSGYQSDSHVWEGHYTTGLPAGISLTAMCEKAITPLAYQQVSVWQPCVRRPLHHWLTSRYQSDSHAWEGHYTTGLPAGINLTAMYVKGHYTTGLPAGISLTAMCEKAITPLAYQQGSIWQPCVRRPLHHWLTSRYQSDSHVRKAITPLAYQQVSVWQPCEKGHYTTGLPAGISLTAMWERPLHHWLTSRYQSDSHVWEGHYTTGLPAGISLTAMWERPLHHWLTSRDQSDSHVWEGHYTTGLPAGISLTAMWERPLHHWLTSRDQSDSHVRKAITPLAYQQVSVWQPCVRRPLHHWLTSRYQSDSHVRKAITPLAYQQGPVWQPCEKGHYTTGLPAGISLTAMWERPLHHWLTSRDQSDSHVRKAITPLAYQQGPVWQPCEKGHYTTCNTFLING